MKATLTQEEAPTKEEPEPESLSHLIASLAKKAGSARMVAEPLITEAWQPQKTRKNS